MLSVDGEEGAVKEIFGKSPSQRGFADWREFAKMLNDVEWKKGTTTEWLKYTWKRLVVCSLSSVALSIIVIHLLGATESALMVGGVVLGIGTVWTTLLCEDY